MLGSNSSEWGSDGNFGIEWGKNLLNLAGFEDFDFDSALLGLDNRDNVAPLHPITWLDQPFHDRARFHVRTKAGHSELGHGNPHARP
jgi:hypothetical protein